MRTIKMLGLVVAAALATMALGAITASADVPCTESGKHSGACAAGAVYTGSIVGKTTTEKAKLLNSTLGVLEECNSEVLAGAGTNEGNHVGYKVLIATGDIKFTNCSGICNKATSEAPAWMLVEALTLDAFVTADGALAPSARLEECEFGVNCLYRFTNATSLLRVESDLIIANHVPLTESTSEFLCPNSTTWDGKYLISKDEANGANLFIAALT